MGTPVPGDLKYRDLNGDKVVDSKDRQVLGSYFPKINFGLNLSVQYKDFDLSALLQGAADVKSAPVAEIRYAFYNGGKVTEQHLDRWTPENPNAELPAFMLSASNPEEYSWYDSKTIWRDLDIWVKKLNYVRLQNLRLGYRIPELLTKRLGMNSATVSVEGRNLFVFGSGYNNYMDPESMYNPYATPVPKSVTFSLNLNF